MNSAEGVNDGDKVTGTRSRISSFLIAAGWLPLAYFVIRTALLGNINSDIRAFQIAYVIGFAGYALLATILLRVKDISKIGSWKWWLIGCIALRLPLLANEPRDDAYRYVWEGRVQLAGMNPYVYAPDDPALTTLRDADWQKINHPDYPAIYPPLAQMQFLAAAAVLPSVYVIKFLHALWDVLTIMVIASCLKRRNVKPHLAALYGLCPLVITGFAVEGHLDSLMLLMMALMTWSVMGDRARLAGLFLALAVSAKIVAVIFVPWFLFSQRRALPVAAAVLILTYLPYAGAGMSLFDSLLRFTRESPFFSLLGALSVTSFDTELSRRIVAALMGIALVVLGWRRKDLTHYGIAATGVLVALSPIVHAWYLAPVLLFIPFQFRISWLATAAAMVLYYEADWSLATTGVWEMPLWVPKYVWWVLVVSLAGESVLTFLRRRPRPEQDSS